jgi:hypothetical protein
MLNYRSSYDAVRWRDVAGAWVSLNEDASVDASLAKADDLPSAHAHGLSKL